MPHFSLRSRVVSRASLNNTSWLLAFSATNRFRNCAPSMRNHLPFAQSFGCFAQVITPMRNYPGTDNQPGVPLFSHSPFVGKTAPLARRAGNCCHRRPVISLGSSVAIRGSSSPLSPTIQISAARRSFFMEQKLAGASMGRINWRALTGAILTLNEDDPMGGITIASRLTIHLKETGKPNASVMCLGSSSS